MKIKTLPVVLGVAIVSAATTGWSSEPRITATRIETDRAVIQGETDTDHDLVLRIDDGSAKPRESGSWANKNGKFEYVFQITDKIRMEGGKTGIGVEASCTVGNSGAIAYLSGKFTMRPKVQVNKDDSVTFADLEGDDGRTLPVSFLIRARK